MGAPAAEKCDDFGWHPQGVIDKSLVAETAQDSRFGMGHAWSRSAEYSLTTDPARTYMVLTVEGGFEFTVHGTPVRADPGSLILLDGEAPTAARTLTDTARYVWYLEPTFLSSGHGFRHGEPIPTGGASIQALTSMTNTLLSVPAPTSPTARRHLAASFENLLAGVLDEAGADRRQDASHHREGTFMAALSVIETRFRDPAFTVARLAKELSVSQRTLYEVFEDMGSTPRREIERRRVTEADHLAGAGTMPVSELATRSGFTSPRQLARALTRAHSLDPQNASTLPA